VAAYYNREVRKTIRIGSAAADCADLAPMVEFWGQVLDYRIVDEGEGWTYLEDPQSRGPGLFLQQVPDPTPGKNRWHLDLYSRDEEREAARLEELGATRVRKFEAYEGAIKGTTLVVMRDIEGNEFCIVRNG
jgi:predicted enzyme related to lactoylglutathione lyase